MLSELVKMWVKLSLSRNLPTINTLINISRTVVIVIVALIGLYLAKYNLSDAEKNTIYIISVVFIVFVILVVSVVILFRATSRSRRVSQYNPDIWVRERDQICHVLTKNDHRLFYDLKIEFIADNISSFLLYIEWSGERNIEFELQNSNFSYTCTESVEARIRFYRIVFDYPRNCGEALNLRYNVTGHSVYEEDSDFMSHTFTDKKVPERASLAVRFKGKFPVEDVGWQSFSPPNAHRSTNTPESLQLDSDRTIRKEFKPIENTRYVIAWRYKKRAIM